jgi:2-polyprenyl-6-methoxyphenol hydroxylase-like FAD-dependent oxidoreductase
VKRFTRNPGLHQVTEHVTTPRDDDADVIVVGAGPSGSTAAFYLAQAGLNVLLIEKSRFPRDKVCGDGLTPRAVKSLIAMGVDVSEKAGWLRNKGLRVIGGGMRLELDWPELSSWPGYGLVRPRSSLDEQAARGHDGHRPGAQRQWPDRGRRDHGGS